MARKKLGEEVKKSNNDLGELEKLCESYIANKAEESKYSNLAKSENKQIKDIMNQLDVTSCTTNIGTVKISVTHNDSFREDDLIEFLKEHGVAKGIVKKKEYVDFEALESAIYHEKIEASIIAEMDSCKNKSEVVKLLISKAKGE